MLANPASQRFQYQEQSRIMPPIPNGSLLSIEWEKVLWRPWYEEKSVVIPSSVEETLNLLRSLNVVIPQPALVRDYLFCHPDMTRLLVPICDAARQRFGARAQLSLEVYRDPEIEDEYFTLYVRQKKYDEDVLRQIKEIRKYYAEILAGKTGWFLLTTDFQPPR